MGNWVVNCTSIVGNWYFDAAMTLATVLATIPVLFFLMVHAGVAYWHLFHVACSDVDTCRSFTHPFYTHTRFMALFLGPPG